MAENELPNVWASRALMDSTRTKGFTAEPMTVHELARIQVNNELGNPMAEHEYPKAIFALYWDRKEKKQADLIMAAGILVVSAECSEILRKFNLGHSSLYPIRLFQHDRTTLVDGTYFALKIAERKHAFVPEDTKEVNTLGNGELRVPSWLEDGDVTVTSAACDGVDLWVDPPLTGLIFISDRLTAALRAAKMSRVFGFRKCRVVLRN